MLARLYNTDETLLFWIMCSPIGMKKTHFKWTLWWVWFEFSANVVLLDLRKRVKLFLLLSLFMLVCCLHMCISILFLKLDQWADVVCLSVPLVCMCCQMYSSAWARLHACVCAFTQHLECVLSQQWQNDRMTGVGKWVSHALSRMTERWMNGLRWTLVAEGVWLREKKNSQG